MAHQQPKKVKLKIHGMHCASCEVTIERKFKKVSGIEKVYVNYHNGKAEILCSQKLNINELNDIVKPDGYRVSFWENRNQTAYQEVHKNTVEDYFQMGGIFLIII